MVKKNGRLLTVEGRDTEAVVEFLDANVLVTLGVGKGGLLIIARMMHDENASTWDEHTITWPLPERDEQPVCANCGCPYNASEPDCPRCGKED